MIDTGWPAVAFVTAVFLLGGLVKGVIAFGLPLVTVPLLSQIFPVPVAIAVSLVSVVASSLVQAFLCRQALPVLRRVWPLILGLGATIPLSAQIAGAFDPRALDILIGVFIEALVAMQWLGLRPPLPAGNRRVALATGGALSGVFGGLTSFYSFPSVQILLSLGLTSLEFAFATNVMFLVGSASLGGSLGSRGVFTADIVPIALWALVPLMLGLLIGQSLRGRIPQEGFRRLVLLMLAATGASLIHRGVAGL